MRRYKYRSRVLYVAELKTGGWGTVFIDSAKMERQFRAGTELDAAPSMAEAQARLDGFAERLGLKEVKTK